MESAINLSLHDNGIKYNVQGLIEYAPKHATQDSLEREADIAAPDQVNITPSGKHEIPGSLLLILKTTLQLLSSQFVSTGPFAFDLERALKSPNSSLNLLKAVSCRSEFELSSANRQPNFTLGIRGYAARFPQVLGVQEDISTKSYGALAGSSARCSPVLVNKRCCEEVLKAKVDLNTAIRLRTMRVPRI